jgi:glutaredoxin
MPEPLVLELYWMPGCSSCLRMKEFVESTGKPFIAINVDADPEQKAKIMAKGLFLPVAGLGDKYVNGANLEEVAELAGVPYEPRALLSAAELKSKYELIMAAFLRYLAQMPPEGLEYKLSNRDRPMLDVAYQCACVARAFLSAYYEDNHDVSIYEIVDGVRGADDIEVLAHETLDMVDKWWTRDGQDDELDRVIGTYWGYRQLHEVFEREVWHTAHHTRQIMYVLGVFDIIPNGPLTEELLRGLPLPERIHE